MKRVLWLIFWLFMALFFLHVGFPYTELIIGIDCLLMFIFDLAGR